MKIDIETTRQLAEGEMVLSTDFIVVDGELHLTDSEEEGKIIHDETCYRRSLQGDPYQLINTYLGLRTQVAKDALRIAFENIQLMDGKQLDYGSQNISAFGEYGVVVRMSDKMERLKNLIKKDSVNNESIEDTYKDLANYAVISLLIRRNLWK